MKADSNQMCCYVPVSKQWKGLAKQYIEYREENQCQSLIREQKNIILFFTFLIFLAPTRERSLNGWSEEWI